MEKKRILYRRLPFSFIIKFLQYSSCVKLRYPCSITKGFLIQGVGKGRPIRISKGDKWLVLEGVILISAKTAGSTVFHLANVQHIAFLILSLTVQFILSTIPELCGWYGMWNFHSSYKVLTSSRHTLETNAGPLSEFICLQWTSPPGYYFLCQDFYNCPCIFPGTYKDFYPPGEHVHYH